MNVTKINMLCIRLQSLMSSISSQLTPVNVNVVLRIREDIVSVVQQLSESNPTLGDRLAGMKDALFTEMPYQQFFINPIVCGQIFEVLQFAKTGVDQMNCANLCYLLHPDIQKVSEKLYRDGSYAEAACNALIEINSRLKRIYRGKYPDAENVPDGQTLMNKIFADKDPVLEAGDLSTQTGKDIQMGTRFMLAGAIAALRNPKSHENIALAKEDSMRQLIFASMLMYKIDEIIMKSEETHIHDNTSLNYM